MYNKVPKDLLGNLKWRRELFRRVEKEPAFADVLWQACAADLFFYINSFVWTHNPRLKGRKAIPFITYPFQDEGLDELLDSVSEHHDVVIAKSRDMGASWLCLTAIEWMWKFRPLQTFLMGSRTDDTVDKGGDPKSLFWKIDFLQERMPPWLMPRGFDPAKHRKKNTLVNPANGSVCTGEATTENFSRAGRYTIVLCDELAACDVGSGMLTATRDATDTRWGNSTPQGNSNAYAQWVRLARKDPRKTRLLRFHWSEHPVKARGLYRTLDDKLEILDKEYIFPPDYPFLLDDKLRSPWYDDQCSRALTPQEIAQELDIDFLGSGWGFFDGKEIESLIQRFCAPPLLRGELHYDPDLAEPEKWDEQPRGRLQLWFELDVYGKAALDRPFIVAVDAAVGTGASNSAISIWDSGLKEKVGEYADPNIKPEKLAKLAVALCRWLNGAHLIWETNLSGRQFGDAVLEIGYGNYYSRQSEGTESSKRASRPGWAPTKENKYALLSHYRGALLSGDLLNRSEQAMRETLEYVYMGNQWVDHVATKDSKDPSGARSQHGDRVIADALAAHVMKGRAAKKKRKVFDPPPLSYAGRRKMRLDKERPKKSIYVFATGKS